jgi:hypothetical protein
VELVGHLHIDDKLLLLLLLLQLIIIRFIATTRNRNLEVMSISSRRCSSISRRRAAA